MTPLSAQLKRRAGRFGEDAAIKYLSDIGYKIEGRNFRCREGELDIIALDGGCLVFIEVKTRSSAVYGRPSEAVDERKRRRIIKAAYAYCKEPDCEIRFDVIEVMYFEYGGKLFVREINHIKNAFETES